MDISAVFILLIIGSISFFCWRWVFKISMKRKEKINAATWTATIISTPLIYIGLICLIIFIFSYYPERPFQSEKWKKDPEKRFELSEDLIERNLLIGLNKQQVEQLLGKTESANETEWSYYIGFVPRFGSIDPDIIEITFKNGVVIQVKQRTT